MDGLAFEVNVPFASLSMAGKNEIYTPVRTPAQLVIADSHCAHRDSQQHDTRD